MHAAGKMFVKTYLKAIRDTFFPNMRNFPICYIFIQLKGKVETFRLAGRPSPSPFPYLSGTSWSPHGLLTVMIFFQSKKFTACKIKDEKEETIFYFLMMFNLLKIIHPFESKKHLRTYWNLVATHGNIWYVTNRFK